MPLTRITLRQFEAFVAVADMRSFAAASERLGMTASAVSQLVAELESTIGFRVFDRSTRKVNLSSAGRDFLASAETVLRHVQLAESAATDVRNRAAGVVRVGAPLVLAGSVLPAAIRAFGEQRPKVVIRIRDTAVDALAESVATGDVDLAVGPDRAPGAGVAREMVFDSPWVLWCAPTHPLAALKVLHWDQLHDVALVAAGRDHERSVAQMHVNAPEGERVRPVHVVDNVSTALGLAAEGLSVTLAPAYVGVLAERLGLVMRRVTKPETIRQVCVYRPTARAMPPAAEAFTEFLVDWLRAWQTGVWPGRKSAIWQTARPARS
ncbi:LysR family transcriptional regulator [Variovorax terrae]|uniref:LysR family transcriptional regulator n=1 Tax=Variovorax terrae TaxID=2923278 RepID=A0A9X1W011_9BURK|nr:LysR family transcriptional regulator [Variovorax terrae]MCJ0765197.1 LysR family transcriptional regulator [Variovorax terrae]